MSVHFNGNMALKEKIYWRLGPMEKLFSAELLISESYQSYLRGHHNGTDPIISLLAFNSE
jgi:hypothetical protein